MPSIISDLSLADWLEKHKLHLADYSTYEVDLLASACGFPLYNRSIDLAHWLNRTKRQITLWESPLHEQWVMLWLYNNGKDWEDQ